MPTVCSQCGGSDIEYDHARGDAVCTSCGSVLEDNIIVSEVTFQEQSSGASSLVGQFVSAERGGGAKSALSGAGFHHGLSRDSREVTLQNAKHRLNKLGTLLKLNQHCCDTALGFFKMALQLNLTRGRKSSIMDTACLYLVCRSEGTPHMLLDFSDVLQINVYSLGRAYLKLSNALHINPPAIDPCLYIHRFAHKLELGEKVREVSMTALRLVARMKRDWIHHGRRPAGLCGAALLVSSRMHNFSRTVKEVARVVKLSEGTIRKRLGDFRDTPSSRLTIDEFLKIDLEQEHDPPCFLEAKKKSKNVQHKSVNDSYDEDDEFDKCGGVGGGDGDERTLGMDTEEQEIGFAGIKLSSVEEIIAKARMAEAFLTVPIAGLSDDLNDLAKLGSTPEAVDGESAEGGGANNEDEAGEGSENEESGELDLEGIDDEEIDRMMLSEEEVKIKTRLWFAENADYLKELEEKKERLAAIEAEKLSNPNYKKRAPRKKKKEYYTPASSAGEAIERMLVEKKISTKINYDVLKNLDMAIDTGEQCKSNEVIGADPYNDPQDTSFDQGGQGEHWSAGPLGPNRLPSLRTRKRTFLSMGPSSSGVSTVSQRTPSTNHHPPSLKHPRLLDYKDEVKPVNNDSHIASTDGGGGGGGGGGDGGGGGGVGSVAVVEESGPVQYLQQEEEEEEDDEEEEEGGLGDEEMDDLQYEGDPLLDSDYEEAADDF